MRSIELLAPARDLECGLEAIRHGADAVYIGAPRFGARAAAGNSVDDIAALVRYAHPFGVRIYATVNTLLRDDELADVDVLIDQLKGAGVDALIVQDPRLRALNRGRLPLHASTQMDNRTLDDVRARQADGYEQTVLARELSLEEIKAIHASVPEMPLEVFVHGALCVSYSGRCYASEYCFGRSANRGECAQFCRLPFDLVDADRNVVEDPRTRRPFSHLHLLSLFDMNRSSSLEALMDAGVSSFKIEGRLKDVSYVKNITAYYRQCLDTIISRRADEYCRSSRGQSEIAFVPNPQKSFNRRFTDYFLYGRNPKAMSCFASPKALGEPVGQVKDANDNSLAVAGAATFANGDGLCFFDADDRLQGFRVNSVDAHGRLYPADRSVLSLLRRGTKLYRNVDAAFERTLSRPTAERRIHVHWRLENDADQFCLTLMAEDGVSVSRSFSYPLELARSPQEGPICRQLLRLGDTIFTAAEADVDISLTDNWFVPASVLADWRRQLCELLSAELAAKLPAQSALSTSDLVEADQGASVPSTDDSDALMTCRYCLRQALGFCSRDGRTLPWRTPLALRLADGRSFPLRFDCQRCEMQVLRPSSN